ncbi:phosphonate ABC transporter, permease protein PhnE [Oceanobacillus damuensis]|uniref:phosphonate ABC transporter, permease protein PhnE n=1 Tax=Oceanobacillus damuensis TaxID=937928 RepID=UPI00082C0591|nr:phosphonate ABC transporter, permease protein PhnE [Oceanobacillus damuensis]
MTAKNNSWIKHIRHPNALIIIAILFVFSFSQLNITFTQFFESFERGKYMLDRMFPPQISEPMILFEAVIQSLQVAVVGTVLGIIISLILAIFAASNLSPYPLVSYVIKAFAAFVRSVPALIWAMLFIIAVGFGPTPGILAIAVNSIGMLVKVYAESIEEMDVEIIEAIRSTGASPLQVIFQGVFASIVSILISWSVFRFDINVRYSSILGVVGAGGIGWELMAATQSSRYDLALGVTFVIFLMIISIEYFTRFIKRQLESI